MIRKLRIKLTAFVMIMLTLVLTGVLLFAFYSFSVGLRESSMRTLQIAADTLGRPHPPGSPEIGGVGNCFLLERERDGTVKATGAEQFDLTDQETLQELLEKVEDKKTGELMDEELRFLRVEGGPGTKYVFMDISGEVRTVSNLIWSYILIYIAGLCLSLVISILLAKWAVKPAEQAWNQQRQFVADASHELKTPLTVILTNAELLKDSEGQTQPYSDNIITMSHQMRGLVEDLLEQARIDQAQPLQQRTTVDMSKLARDAILPFEPVYYEAGKYLLSEIEDGITLSGSPAQLCRMVEILLDNGCKYSTPGGTVLLRLTRRYRHCLLSVTSPGKELTRQEQTDIFKRFYRLDSVRPMEHSYGLGLSIASGIVKQHKGKIWVQSAKGHNTFFVLLPL